MLGEGVEPASIEHAGSQAGYPAPPLQLSDELNLELMHKIALATRKGVEDAGGTYEPHPAEAVVEKMIEIGRPSRLSGAGFYEYVDGKRTQLWPGAARDLQLGHLDPPAAAGHDRPDAVRRGAGNPEVLRRGRDHHDRRRQHRLDHGHRLPAVDRCAAQLIVGYPHGGKAGFVARAKELAEKYGERFNPPASLL